MKVTQKLALKNEDVYHAKTVTMAFLGDSVTHGCFENFWIGEERMDTIYDDENVYHAKLKKLIKKFYPRVPVNIINAGISGGSAPNGLERLERDVLNFKPDLVVVCFGLNDVHNGLDGIAVYENALRNIFVQLKKADIEIIFMTPNMMNTKVSPHVTNSFMRSMAEKFALVQNNGDMDCYMEAARRICKEENIPVCDCYSKWKQLEEAGVDVTELLANHLNHPIREMHDLFAEEIRDMILYK